MATVVRDHRLCHGSGMVFPLPRHQDRNGRRSRFHRQPTGKRLVLTDRDVGIFRLLWRYRFLRSDRIVARLNPKSCKRLIERLGDLYHEAHYIDRPAAQWRRARSEQMPIACELTKRGLQAYAEAEPSLTLPYPAVNFGGAINRTILQFDHGLSISETLFDVEMALLAGVGRRFVVERTILDKVSARRNKPIKRVALPVSITPSPFMPLQKQAYKTCIVPDALFGVEHVVGDRSLYRFYALEVECRSPLRRRSLDKTSTLRKLLAYQALLRTDAVRRHLTLPNLFVIFAADTPHHLLNIMAMADEIWSEEERKLLLFAPPPKIPATAADMIEGTSTFVELNRKWFEHFGHPVASRLSIPPAS